MSDIAIRVENLGKMYRIGTQERRPDNLWQAARQLAASPFEYLRRITRPPTEEETLWALRDVSFEVKRGEVMGIIGRNGAGKSTLLKILSRITEPTTGTAEIHGRVGSLLEVGTGFHPELTGRENIYLNGAILGMKRTEIDRKFDEIVDFSGVERFLDTPVKRYSSGMYVRLAFAVAAHLEPEILLVDEVLAVGDAAFQKKCLGKMGDVAQEGRTVLFVSHNMGALTTLCPISIWLDSGQLRKRGQSDEIVRIYLDSKDNCKSAISLGLRSDRVGTGEVRFDEIWLSRVPRGQPVEEFRTGEEVFVNLVFTSKLKTDVFIGLQVKDTLDRIITSFNSREGGGQFSISEGQNTLMLHVPWNSLLEGHYSISGALVSVENVVSYDRVEYMTDFHVYPNDFMRVGSPFRAFHGVVFIPHTWLPSSGSDIPVIPSQHLLERGRTC